MTVGIYPCYTNIRSREQRKEAKKMRKALLIPFTGAKEGYVWQNTKEQDISPEYDTKEQALANRPDGYKCLDDGWQEV